MATLAWEHRYYNRKIHSEEVTDKLQFLEDKKSNVNLIKGITRKQSDVTINPITYGGGGGLFGPDHQIIDHNSKTALSSTSKLGDFLFLSIRHTLAEF